MSRDHRGARVSMHDTNAKACDICEKPFKPFDRVYDCPLQGVGSWAFMCTSCVDDYGQPKLGTVHTVVDPPS